MDKIKNNLELLKFPCQYPIKIIGKANVEFVNHVIVILRKHIVDLDVEKIKVNPSKNGNYEALTVNFLAISQQQIDDLYRELSANNDILMVL